MGRPHSSGRPALATEPQGHPHPLGYRLGPFLLGPPTPPPTHSGLSTKLGRITPHVWKIALGRVTRYARPTCLAPTRARRKAKREGLRIYVATSGGTVVPKAQLLPDRNQHGGRPSFPSWNARGAIAAGPGGLDRPRRWLQTARAGADQAEHYGREGLECNEPLAEPSAPQWQAQP